MDGQQSIGTVTSSAERPSVSMVYQAMLRQGLIIAFLIFMGVLSALSPHFLTVGNLLSVLRQASVLGCVALGVTVVVIGGNLDLSVGSLLSFTTVVAVTMENSFGPFGAIIATLIVALICGSITGFLVGFVKLNSLIVTLAMLSAIQGVVFIYTSGNNVDVANPGSTWFSFIGRGFIGDLDFPIIIFALVAISVEVLLYLTGFGRRVFATGGNAVATTYAGINPSLVVFATYLVSALTTGVAGLIMASRVMGAQNDAGQGYELEALAGIILGGTSLLGGSGSASRTVIGVLIVGFIRNGLILIGLPYYSQWLVEGVVIVLAAWLDLAAGRGKVFSDIT